MIAVWPHSLFLLYTRNRVVTRVDAAWHLHFKIPPWETVNGIMSGRFQDSGTSVSRLVSSRWKIRAPFLELVAFSRTVLHRTGALLRARRASSSSSCLLLGTLVRLYGARDSEVKRSTGTKRICRADTVLRALHANLQFRENNRENKSANALRDHPSLKARLRRV